MEVVEGERTAEGDKLYLVRYKVKGKNEDYFWIAGRYDSRTRGAFTSYNLEELACNSSFQFLTCAKLIIYFLNFKS